MPVGCGLPGVAAADREYGHDDHHQHIGHSRYRAAAALFASNAASGAATAPNQPRWR